MTPLFYRYEPHVTKVNKNIQNEKLTFLEEIRGIQNCMAGKAYKLNSSNTENRGPLRPLPLAPVYNTSILHVI